MSGPDITRVRTVASHLVSIYREHGLEAFQSELDIILERISELAKKNLFDGDFKLYQLAQKLFQALEIPESHFGSCYKKLVEAVGQAETVREKCAQFRNIVLSYLAAAAAAAEAEAAAAAEAEAGKTPELAVQVRTYLKKCPTKELRALNVDLLADRFKVTRNHLSRCYHQRFDRTLHRAILSERMSRAFAMLSDKEDKHTVQQIAELVGYRSVVQFRKVFREHFGLAPGHVLYPERY